jgi:hypothetical protein
MNQSEVARLREKIELEYQASQRVLTGFTPTARHDFITKRQENIAGYFQDLTRYMSKEEAILLVVNAENGLSGESNASL